MSFTTLKRLLPLLAFGCVLSLPAYAALAVGASAPDFTAKAALAGKRTEISLARALKAGPVVLYFYPKAFTGGCTYEAHAFAEAVGDFQKLGARVIGVSNDDLKVLDKFSQSECAGKFPVLSDPDSAIIKAYDARLSVLSGMADRVSYVIAPDGKIVFVYAAMDPDKHVTLTLDAVRKWKAGK